jgi:DNA-binding response OmpR family regulator
LGHCRIGFNPRPRYDARVAVVLLVDSDPAAQESIRAGLQACGHAVVPAGTASLGVERLREGGIDTVVVDPCISGGLSTFLAALTNLPDPPPFIILSGSVDGPALSARFGAATFLAKPCPMADLVEAIAGLLGHSSTPVAIDDHPTRPVEPRGWSSPSTSFSS